MGTEKQRKEITSRILNTVYDKGIVDKKKLLAIIAIEYGKRLTTVQSYCQLLCDAELLYEKEGILYNKVEFDKL